MRSDDGGLTRRTALAAFVAAGLANPARASTEATVLRIAHSHATSFPIHQGLVHAGELLHVASAGRLKLDVVPDGKAGIGADVFHALRDGRMDAMIYVAATLVDAVGAAPALNLFDAPFVARDWDHMSRIAQSAWAQQTFQELAANKGIRQVGLPWRFGTRHVTNSVRPITKVADMKGLRIRVPNALPLYEDLFTDLGAVAVPLAYPQLYEQLKAKSIIDGQENALPTIESAKLYEVQSHLALTAHTINPYFVFFGGQSWTRLSIADRAVLTDCLNQGAGKSNAMFASLESSLRVGLQDRGMRVTDVDQDGFRVAASKLHKKLAQSWGNDTLAKLQSI